MTTTIAAVLLALCLVGGLVVVPLGLPGLWVMLAGVIAYGWLTGFHAVGAGTIVTVLALAFAAELVEAWLSFALAKRYGGSSRAGWGALLGGVAGAMMGVPVPLIGSIIGALVGSLVGAALFEYWASGAVEPSLRAGWGALVARAAGAAAKTAIGIAIAVVAGFAAIRG